MKYSRIEDAEDKDEIGQHEVESDLPKLLEGKVDSSDSKSCDCKINVVVDRNDRTKDYVLEIERKHQVLLAKYRNNISMSLKSYGDKLFENPQRRYKLWQGNDTLFFSSYFNSAFSGNNTFFLSGIVFTGAHAHQVPLSLALISFTWLSFFFGILPFFHDSTPCYITLLFMLGCYSSFFCTSFMDPGIYPRRQVFPLSLSHTQHPLFLLPTPNMSAQTKEQDIFLQFYYDHYQYWKEEYCELCGILHTKRTRHCKYCNNCVHTFDHHCPWTGNCIGKRNYFPYFFFLSITVLSLVYMLYYTVLLLLGWAYNLPCNVYWIRAGCGLCMLLWICLLLTLIGSLWILHIYLILIGKTTSEFFRGRKLSHNSMPSRSRGSFRKTWSVMCTTSCTSATTNTISGEGNERMSDNPWIDWWMRRCSVIAWFTLQLSPSNICRYYGSSLYSSTNRTYSSAELNNQSGSFFSFSFKPPKKRSTTTTVKKEAVSPLHDVTLSMTEAKSKEAAAAAAEKDIEKGLVEQVMKKGSSMDMPDKGAIHLLSSSAPSTTTAHVIQSAQSPLPPPEFADSKSATIRSDGDQFDSIRSHPQPHQHHTTGKFVRIAPFPTNGGQQENSSSSNNNSKMTDTIEKDMEKDVRDSIEEKEEMKEEEDEEDFLEEEEEEVEQNRLLCQEKPCRGGNDDDHASSCASGLCCFGLRNPPSSSSDYSRVLGDNSVRRSAVNISGSSASSSSSSVTAYDDVRRSIASSQTKLLPFWQLVNEDDVYLQETLLDELLIRYQEDLIKIEFVLQSSSSSTNSPVV